jgi:hypothetical protein
MSTREDREDEYWDYLEETHRCKDCGRRGCEEPYTIPGLTGPGFPAGGGPPEHEGWCCQKCEVILCEDCASPDNLCQQCREEEANELQLDAEEG